MHAPQHLSPLVCVACASLLLCAALVATPLAGDAAQRTVRGVDARVEVTDATSARAHVTIENGTMYEVYVVSATSDAAATTELTRATDGKAEAVKEVPIPAFDRLEMSNDGVYLRLTGLTRALKAGDTITISLKTDSGEVLTVAAPVK
jgi:copper(I)-binding protein